FAPGGQNRERDRTQLRYAPAAGHAFRMPHRGALRETLERNPRDPAGATSEFYHRRAHSTLRQFTALLQRRRSGRQSDESAPSGPIAGRRSTVLRAAIP